MLNKIGNLFLQYNVAVTTLVQYHVYSVTAGCGIILEGWYLIVVNNSTMKVVVLSNVFQDRILSIA